MVFSSITFVFLFLPLVLIFYFIAYGFKNIKLMNIILLVFSFLFVLYGSGKDIVVLIAIILINFIAGLSISKSSKKTYRRLFLILGVSFSLGILFYFKYAAFFLDSFFSVLKFANINLQVPSFVTNILLPLGISFYTFQSLSYTIDVYNENVEATESLIDFSMYISFFPQLIAGPIVRYIDIYKQIKQRDITYEKIYSGTVRFLMGLSKKVLLANTVSKAADGIFALDFAQLNTPLAWLGILAYTLQIYLDFSAYSDMAIGLARIFGFELLENFNFPYIATTVQDFWRRWHISLSTWLKDYLYIPLGGNRKGKTRTYVNLLLVFFLSGLWHGANWTFIVWGLWHGMFLLIERTKIGTWIRKIPVIIRRIYVVLQFTIGWVIFRSDNLMDALMYAKRLFIYTPQTSTIKIICSEFYQNDVIIATVLGILSSIGLFVMLKNKMKKSTAGNIIFNIALLAVTLLTVAKLYSGGYNPFIYFRF